ncbi:MAG: hypothetical protein J7K65_04780 [Planctomycetes bacterium]|nr:hypothetical protein [Planctomycetota bacterium]
MVACAGQLGTQLGTSQRVRSHGTPSGGLRRSAFVGYDYENRIVEIEDVGDTTVAAFAYDALGRRIKTVSYDSAGSAATYFYYNDQWQVLAEYDGTAFGNLFVYGNYIDEVLRMNDGTNDYYYAHDHLYSPAALMETDGDVVERYEYDAYSVSWIPAQVFLAKVLNPKQIQNDNEENSKHLMNRNGCFCFEN